MPAEEEILPPETPFERMMRIENAKLEHMANALNMIFGDSGYSFSTPNNPPEPQQQQAPAPPPMPGTTYLPPWDEIKGGDGK